MDRLKYNRQITESNVKPATEKKINNNNISNESARITAAIFKVEQK